MSDEFPFGGLDLGGGEEPIYMKETIEAYKKLLTVLKKLAEKYSPSIIYNITKHLPNDEIGDIFDEDHLERHMDPTIEEKLQLNVRARKRREDEQERLARDNVAKIKVEVSIFDFTNLAKLIDELNDGIVDLMIGEENYNFVPDSYIYYGKQYAPVTEILGKIRVSREFVQSMINEANSESEIDGYPASINIIYELTFG